MAFSKTGDLRGEKRFSIECPVTAVIQGRGKSREVQGTLREMWKGGARLYLDRPLAVGTRLILYVRFAHADKNITMVRFAGIVMHSCYEARHETVMRLQGRHKFLTKAPRNDRGIKARVVSA